MRARHHHAALPVCFVNVCLCSQQQLHHFETAMASSPMQGSVSRAPEGEKVTAEESDDEPLLPQLCTCKMRQEKSASQQFAPQDITSPRHGRSWNEPTAMLAPGQRLLHSPQLEDIFQMLQRPSNTRQRQRAWFQGLPSREFSVCRTLHSRLLQQPRGAEQYSNDPP